MRHDLIDKYIRQFQRGLVTLPEFVDSVNEAMLTTTCDCLQCVSVTV